MLEQLRQITQAVSLAQDQRQALEVMVERICRVLKVEVCSVYVADYQINKFVLMATRGLNPACVGRLQVDFNQGLVGLIGRREEPLHLTEASKHPEFLRVPEVNEDCYNAYLGVPIIHRRKVQGVLCIQQRLPRQFSIEEETFLITLAAQISAALSQPDVAKIITPSVAPSFEKQLQGVAAANGLVIAKARVLLSEFDIHRVPDRTHSNAEQQLQRLGRAVKATHLQLQRLSKRLQGLVSEQERSLFDAYQKILASPGLAAEIEAEIKRGHWAPTALRLVIERHLAVFETMTDPYLRERASDLEDLANRVLANLLKQAPDGMSFQGDYILVTDNLTSTLIAELADSPPLAVVSARGSSTSHAAILAKAMGIPAVMGVEGLKASELEGKVLVVDGYTGQITIEPAPHMRAHYQRLIGEEKALQASLKRDQNRPCEHRDGRPFYLLVNSNNLRELTPAFAAGACGIGLYRSEIHFMLRDQFPSERAQQRIYANLFKACGDRPLIFRTLDIGGDKQLRYFPIADENPYLGWRGIRVTLDHPDILLSQLRALFRALPNRHRLQVAFPMVATLQELDAARRMLQQAWQEVQEEKQTPAPMPQLGMILEVPAPLLNLEDFLQRVDFISVGSNDLLQFLLAVDRNNQRVNALYSHFQPALLQALKRVVEACQQADIALHLCGEMAADPLAAALLVGMGYDHLSVNGQSLFAVKRALRAFSHDELSAMAEHALSLNSAQAIRDWLLWRFEQANLGGLVRAGS